MAQKICASIAIRAEMRNQDKRVLHPPPRAARWRGSSTNAYAGGESTSPRPLIDIATAADFRSAQLDELYVKFGAKMRP